MAVIIDDFLENNLPLISLPVTEFNTVKEVFEMYPSFKIKQFLTNGKEYKRYLDFTAETANI